MMPLPRRSPAHEGPGSNQIAGRRITENGTPRPSIAPPCVIACSPPCAFRCPVVLHDAITEVLLDLDVQR